MGAHQSSQITIHHHEHRGKGGVPTEVLQVQPAAKSRTQMVAILRAQQARAEPQPGASPTPPGTECELAACKREAVESKREIAELRAKLARAESKPASSPTSAAATKAEPPAAASGGLEQRLDRISLLRLLLDGCSMTLAAVGGMSPGQLATLVSETLGPVLTAAVVEAVHPSGGGQGQGGGQGGGQGSGQDGGQGGEAAAATSRGKYRQTLSDVIGPPDPSRSWRADFKPAMDAGMKAAGLEYKDYPHRETVEKLAEMCLKNGNTKNKMATGYSRQEAEVLQAITNACVASQIGLALSEGSPRYSALTHAGYNALARKAREGAVAPKCYMFVTDTRHYLGLGNKDPRWLRVLTPDETGYRGFTSNTPMWLRKADDQFYSPGGLKEWFGGYYTTDSDVVCFESAAPEQGGKVLHSAVDIGSAQYALPPFTLLAVVKVEAAGQWEYLPGKRINQRLITVRPTFAPPVEQGGYEPLGVEANKFATNRNFLSYGNSEDAQRGLAEITSDPPMTMQQEWARNDTWTNWKGKWYSGRSEYAYVTGTAVTDLPPGKQSASRDKGHEGWAPDRFLAEINSQLRASAKKVGKGEAVELTLNEMLAIRLYTGPGYQPLNVFMREVSKVGADWRRRLVRSHQFSYAATVKHLSDGLRKLVCVSTEVSGSTVASARMSRVRVACLF
jgi:hypothetical protein